MEIGTSFARLSSATGLDRGQTHGWGLGFERAVGEETLMNSLERRKTVLVLAPFFEGSCAWIDDFCTDPSFEFKKVAHPNATATWHNRGATSSLAEWQGHLKYVYQSIGSEPDCIVTCFPQLAFVVASLHPLMARPKPRIIAWTFNLGSLPGGWKRRVASRVLRKVDRFVVHARQEISAYGKWLGLDEDKFRFVPLQRGKISNVRPSPLARPYVASMGSANRDYETLVNAVAGTGIKTVIIAKKSMLESLPDHPDLIKLSGLSQAECNSILSGAELNVVPLQQTQSAAGQVTFLTSMHLGIPTIATRCIGTIDYIRDGQTGVLIPPNDPPALRAAIQGLWQDNAYRARLGLAGRAQAQQQFSDEVAGQNLANVIHEVLDDDRRPQN